MSENVQIRSSDFQFVGIFTLFGVVRQSITYVDWQAEKPLQHWRFLGKGVINLVPGNS